MHLSRKVARVEKAKWAQKVLFSDSQNYIKTTPIKLKNYIRKYYKPISILHCSYKDDKPPQTPPNHFNFEIDKLVADIPFKASYLDKKRKTATGQNFESIFLILYQAMGKTKSIHHLLNERNKKTGFNICHSKTMLHSNQSRDHLMWSIVSSEKYAY